jgi:cell division septum initiation protein DivIVA
MLLRYVTTRCSGCANFRADECFCAQRKQQSELSRLQSEIQALTSSTSSSTAAAQQAQADINKLQKLCDRYVSELKETKEALSAAQAEVQKGKTFGEGMFREKMRIVDNEKAEMQSEVSPIQRIQVLERA